MYIYHTDAGHGWLAVKRKELIKLGILDKISEYSYQRGNTVYLEEDCDVPLFINARKKIDEKYQIRESYRDNSPIRYYKRFSKD